jgi:ESS family glutamate:Na+ symporter
MIQTVAFAGAILFLGHFVQKRVPLLSRYNIPAPVVGGLIVSVAMLAARSAGLAPLMFDTTLRDPLMIAFFTSIGFGASLSLLKVGGPLVAVFLLISTVIAVVQNLVGGGLAAALGQHPLLGVLAGSVTLTGGPATGLAFAPQFEAAGVQGAAAVAIAAAMAGIISAGLVGGPIGTFLIESKALVASNPAGAKVGVTRADNVVEEHLPEPAAEAPPGEDVEAYGLTKALVAMAIAMGIGAWVSRAFIAMGVTLPAYIGAMLVAALIRNLDDASGLVGLSQRLIDDLGNVALSLFLVIALMTLELWKLAGLALPLILILAVQVAVVALASALVVFPLMGRDYQSAVTSSGFFGFMMGTTASAMASMRVLVERYGAAPRAFLIVPIVGAFFIDFTNALIITAFVNVWK